MRSVFSRIAVMLRNIHFGGALSGIDSIFFAQSMCGIRPKCLASAPSPASAAPAASTASTFFIS